MGTPLRSSRIAAGLVAATVLRGAIAFAGGDTSGHLGAGGTASGDISRTAGETDRVTIDVVEGATLSITFKPTFQAGVVLTDPDGTPVPLALAGTGRQRGSIDVARGGTYTLAIASADGSQGLYKLVARQSLPPTIDIGGEGSATIAFGMPAGGRIGCVVAPAPGAAELPEIARLVDPNGRELVARPIVVRGRSAKLPPIAASAAGTYELTIADAETSAWSGRITRRVRRARPVVLRLANGLDTVSFRGDGVGDVFRSHCASCHGWASSYAGVRRYAFDAISRMASGAMPPGGNVPGAGIGLVRAWISTGRQP